MVFFDYLQPFSLQNRFLEATVLQKLPIFEFFSASSKIWHVWYQMKALDKAISLEIKRGHLEVMEAILEVIEAILEANEVKIHDGCHWKAHD